MMEKYSQFRDRGSGISPFMPIHTPVSRFWQLVHAAVFVVRVPLFVFFWGLYFAVLHHLPLPAVARKACLWCLMLFMGIWWVDLQLDGVKRGSLSEQPPSRVPRPRSVIAVNFTSPIDALYLAAVFDPVFTVSCPADLRRSSAAAANPTTTRGNNTARLDAQEVQGGSPPRTVRRVGLLRMMAFALSRAQFSPTEFLGKDSAAPPEQGQATNGDEDDDTGDSVPATTTGPSGRRLTDLAALVDRYPDRVVCVFPECGTTNGRGILPLSASLLGVPAGVPIFPVSMRYSPADVTTPLPGAAAAWAFFWTLLSRPTHYVRVRIADAVYNDASDEGAGTADAGSSSSLSPAPTKLAARSHTGGKGSDGPLSPTEQRVLDRVGEALARLGRSKRVGLTLGDKQAFSELWSKA